MRAVFLDRDGVLNHAMVRDGRPHPPARLEDVIIYDDAPEALGLLRAAGFALFIVTNQPDVSRGITPRTLVDAINGMVAAALRIEARDILTCFHDDAEQCACRKPKPGLLFAMRDRRGVDLARSFMVGDRWRDVEAGQNARCRTVFLDRGYSERGPTRPADFTCLSILDAARRIVAVGAG